MASSWHRQLLNTQAQMRSIAVSLPSPGTARRQHSTASSRRPRWKSASARLQFGPVSDAILLFARVK
jgi:hypothetical protein